MTTFAPTLRVSTDRRPSGRRGDAGDTGGPGASRAAPASDAASAIPTNTQVRTQTAPLSVLASSLCGVLMLAMDTTTGVVGVALHDGARVLAQEDVARPAAHAEHLAPAIRDVLARAGCRPADVTHVVAGIGPGPFTGLRVGLVTAAAFGSAVGARVGGICSLDAIAHEVWLSGRAGPRVLVATDARRKEVYWAGYRLDESGAHRLGEPAVGRAVDLPQEVRGWPVAGRGQLLYPQALGLAPSQGEQDRAAAVVESGDTDGGDTDGGGSDGVSAVAVPVPVLDVSAGVLAHLAVTRLRAGGELDELRPLYLRRPDAQPQPQRRRVTQARP